jgi:hypothetical protein
MTKIIDWGSVVGCFGSPNEWIPNYHGRKYCISFDRVVIGTRKQYDWHTILLEVFWHYLLGNGKILSRLNFTLFSISRWSESKVSLKNYNSDFQGWCYSCKGCQISFWTRGRQTIVRFRIEILYFLSAMNLSRIVWNYDFQYSQMISLSNRLLFSFLGYVGWW